MHALWIERVALHFRRHLLLLHEHHFADGLQVVASDGEVDDLDDKWRHWGRHGSISGSDNW